MFYYFCKLADCEMVQNNFGIFLTPYSRSTSRVQGHPTNTISMYWVISQKMNFLKFTADSTSVAPIQKIYEYIHRSYHTFPQTHQILTEYIPCGMGEPAIPSAWCISLSFPYKMISAGSCSGSDYIVGVAGSGPVGHALHSHAEESWKNSPNSFSTSSCLSVSNEQRVSIPHNRYCMLQKHLPRYKLTV